MRRNIAPRPAKRSNFDLGLLFVNRLLVNNEIIDILSECVRGTVYLIMMCMLYLLTYFKLENVAIIAMYCHLRPPDAIA